MGVKVPETLSRVRIETLQLSVRSENALKSRQIDTFGQLLQLSDAALLDIRALGVRSLAEIRRTMAKVLSSHGLVGVLPSERDAVESTINRRQLENVSPGGWELPPHHKEEALGSSVDLLDLSARSANVLKRLRITTVRQLVNYPKRELAESGNIGRKSMAEIASKLVIYLSSDPSLDAEPGEGIRAVEIFQPKAVKDFIEKILAPLPDRQRAVVADRYGLWDGIDETLQDIGDKLGLTRERVRQIEAGGLKRIRRLSGHGIIRKFISDNVRFAIETTRAVRFGFVTKEEAVSALAPDCTVEEAELAVTFLQDIQSSSHEVISDSLIEIEKGIYSVDQGTAKDYLEMLNLLEVSLRSREKPLSLGLLIKEIGSHCEDKLAPDRLGFAQRIISVSPTFARLRNGTIALSQWTQFSGHNAPTLAEAALRLLGRPAHFTEIAEKANSIVEEARALTDGTIHNALIDDGEKFIRVKSGTFGLAVWGLKKPPYVKDRLVELLSIAGYPLPLWYLEKNVLEVCNCKRASVRMTLDLNPRMFSRFTGDQYGLQQNSARS